MDVNALKTTLTVLPTHHLLHFPTIFCYLEAAMAILSLQPRPYCERILRPISAIGYHCIGPHGDATCIGHGRRIGDTALAGWHAGK